MIKGLHRTLYHESKAYWRITLNSLESLTQVAGRLDLGYDCMSLDGTFWM
jgi:hypothetical protein